MGRTRSQTSCNTSRRRADGWESRSAARRQHLCASNQPGGRPDRTLVALPTDKQSANSCGARRTRGNLSAAANTSTDAPH